MSRTPLFHLVRRSMQLAQRTAHTGETSIELVEQRREHAISRRRFLSLSASATAAAALGGCYPWTEPRARTDARVLIVGAGIAGLTAAYRLQAAGVPARVLEAQPRVGGRMLSLRESSPTGRSIELGGELIDTGHQHIRALAEELGIELDDLAEADPSIGDRRWFFGGRARSDAEIVEAYRPVAARIARELASLADHDVTYRTPHGAEALDRMSLAEWLDGGGPSGWFRTCSTSRTRPSTASSRGSSPRST
jgi:monoamine oxidase